MTGALNMGTTNKITNLANGTISTDAATVGQSVTTYQTKSGNYTSVASDNSSAIRFTATATNSLTAAATLGANWKTYVIADGGNVTVDPNGSETIGGLATLVIPDGSSAYIICDGTNFQIIYRPAAWVPIGGPLSLSGQSSVSWIDLGSYVDLRLRISGTPSGATANINLRTSSNNGSSYDSGASDYQNGYQNTDGTTVAAIAAVNATQFSLSSVALDAQTQEFNVTLSAWNKALLTIIESTGTTIIASGPTLRNVKAFGRRLTANSFNALQLNISAGTFTNGYALLEGFRG